PDLKPENILCEPARRNTAPCIGYAMAHIKCRVESLECRVVLSPKGHDRHSRMESLECKVKRQNPRVIVAPSDHLILDEAEFLRVVGQALDFVGENDALVTLGMKPTRPETGYGYIKCRVESLECREVESLECREESNIKKVEAFKEKPNWETAKEYMASGDYLWNAGIFVWNLHAIEQAFKNHLTEVYDIFAKGLPVLGTDQEEAFIQTNFPLCPNISIDYGIMEKADNVYVIPADFGWSDLGTWGSLYALSEKGEGENVGLHGQVHFYNAQRNIVATDKGKYVVVEGVNDMIVAERDNVLLICKQQDEQEIRQFVNDYELSKL
ncbi:MAG: hypothetical protein MJZ58_04480, partial [Paludibacteraceae bacterium]|nr:hypothetical protein [Paludibacteraceae bacterium]